MTKQDKNTDQEKHFFFSHGFWIWLLHILYINREYTDISILVFLSGNQGNPLGLKSSTWWVTFPSHSWKNKRIRKTKKMPCRATVTAVLSQQVSWDMARVICMWCACAKSWFAPLWWAISWNRWLFNDKTPLKRQVVF